MNISMAEDIITHTSGGTLVVVDSLGKLLIAQLMLISKMFKGLLSLVWTSSS
jgi:hypothetical protein